jgi:hypothetical protein
MPSTKATLKAERLYCILCGSTDSLVAYKASATIPHIRGGLRQKDFHLCGECDEALEVAREQNSSSGHNRLLCSLRGLWNITGVLVAYRRTVDGDVWIGGGRSAKLSAMEDVPQIEPEDLSDVIASLDVRRERIRREDEVIADYADLGLAELKFDDDEQDPSR